jgi:flagellar biosynthesis protein FlhB
VSGNSSGEKTEKATPKKILDLRKKGQAARSIELPAGVSLLALVLVLPMMVRSFFENLETSMIVVLGGADVTTTEQAKALAWSVLLGAVKAVAPACVIVLFASVASGSLVTFSKPNPHALKPQWNRLSPKASVKRIFSSYSLVELLKTIAKLALLTAVAWSSWKSGYQALLAAGPSTDALQRITGTATHEMLWRVAALALVIGVLDAWYQRKNFSKQAKMSLQEVKEEHKQSEGDPHTKGQIRHRMLAASRQRMIQAVPKADVVLANPTHLVVALAYEPGSSAPVVVARGAGAVADRIKQVAREHDVPVIADKPLARALYKATEVGDTIPLGLFHAVAEVLAVVYAAKRRGTAPRWNRESVLT